MTWQVRSPATGVSMEFPCASGVLGKESAPVAAAHLLAQADYRVPLSCLQQLGCLSPYPGSPGETAEVVFMRLPGHITADPFNAAKRTRLFKLRDAEFKGLAASGQISDTATLAAYALFLLKQPS